MRERQHEAAAGTEQESKAVTRDTPPATEDLAQEGRLAAGLALSESTRFVARCHLAALDRWRATKFVGDTCLGYEMRLAAVAFTALFVSSPVLASPFYQADYQIPVLGDCSDHARLDVENGCVWAWGEGEIFLGIASDGEDVAARDLKIGAVLRVDTEFTGFELGVTVADQYGFSWIDYGGTDFGWEHRQYLRLDDAYVKFARGQLLLSVGRQKTIANFYDDESLSDFHLSGETVAETGLRSNFSKFVGGNGVQVFAGGSGGWSAGLSVEALGEAAWSANRFDLPEANGTLVGVLNYEDPVLSAHSTLLVAGLTSDNRRRVMTHSGVSLDVGAFEAVGALATEYDQQCDALYRDWLVSIAASLSDLRFVLRAQDSDLDGGEYEATVEWAISDALSLGAGRIWNLSAGYNVQTTGAWLQANPIVDVALKAGLYLVETPDDDLLVARGNAVWSATDGTEIEAETRWNNQGAHVLTLALRQRIN